MTIRIKRHCYGFASVNGASPESVYWQVIITSGIGNNGCIHIDKNALYIIVRRSAPKLVRQVLMN